MSFEQQKTIIGRFVEGFNAGDLGVIDALVARDFYNYKPAEDEETAPQVMAALVADLKMALPDLRISVSDLEQVGDEITFSLQVTGTHSGGLWGGPPTGNDLNWTSKVGARFSGGRFAFHWPELSTPELIGALRQLNMVPPPDKMDQPPEHPISVPEFLLKVLFTGQVAEKPCSHLDQIGVVEPTTDVCPQCVAAGDIWPALRQCLICGFVGCCDTSKNKHMKQHYQETGHPLFRSIRLDESWIWCYEDNAFISGKRLADYA